MKTRSSTQLQTMMIRDNQKRLPPIITDIHAAQQTIEQEITATNGDGLNVRIVSDNPVDYTPEMGAGTPSICCHRDSPVVCRRTNHQRHPVTRGPN